MADDAYTDNLRRWMVDTAEKHGAAVMHVDSEDAAPPHAFSVGAWRRFGKPEIVVIGLPREVAHTVVNNYVRRVADGERFVPGQLYEGFVKESPVTVEKVAKGYYAEYLGSAILVYGSGDFPALQMVLSTPGTGIFPWHADAPAGFVEQQPVLTDTGAPESWIPGHDGV